MNKKIVLFANTDWYLYNFRLPLMLQLKGMGFDVVLFAPRGGYAQILEDHGFRFCHVDMDRKGINPFVEIKLITSVYFLFLREKPDLVHFFTLKPSVYGSISSRLAGVRRRITAVTGMGYVFMGSNIKIRMLRFFVCFLIKVAFSGKMSRLILQNDDDKNIFLKYKLMPEDKIHVISGSGVDTSSFLPVDNQEFCDKKVRVLMATRLLWDKGVNEYIEACRKFRSDSNVEFILAGDTDSGNPSAVPFDMIKAWSDEGIVSYLGHVDDIKNLMSEVDIVVLPSYREGTPKVLLEAASMALPIVTTNAPGCREVVKDNVNGLLVPTKDSAALYEAINVLVENPRLRRVMGTAGRKMMISYFDIDIVNKATLAVYDRTNEI